MMNKHRPVVLLVQPERDDREMYVEFLRHVRLFPIPVSTAADALNIAPLADIVVTGIWLPGRMDGIALMARLKSDARTKAIPVVALTAWTAAAERQRALLAGCDRFLVKPCLPDVLAREIRRLLPRGTPKWRPAA